MRCLLSCLFLGVAMWAWGADQAERKPVRPEHRVVPVNQIDTDEGYHATFPEADLEYRHRESREQRLNALGKEGWEACATTPHAWVFRRVSGGPAWEYFVDVRPPHSPLSGEEKGAEKMIGQMERLAADGWQLCTVIRTAAPKPLDGVTAVAIYKRLKKPAAR